MTRLIPKLFLITVACIAVSCSSGRTGGRACIDDLQCATGQICGVGKTCEDVTCTARLQCPGASTCLEAGVCGPEECAVNADCGDAKVCRDRACFSAASLPNCADGGSCSGGKVCNPANNRCEDCSPPQLSCPLGQTCQNGSCRDTNTPCNNDTPCLTTGKVCDLQSNLCVSCSDVRPCPSSHTCEQGVCQARPRCESGQCPSGMTCNSATGFCITAGVVQLCGPCTVDDECAGTGSKCLAFSEGSFCGQDCSGGQSCPSGYACAPQFQQCAPIANRCRDNCVITGCTGGLTCDIMTGLCMGPKTLCDSCANDAECGASGDKCLPNATADGGTSQCSQNCDTGVVGGRPCPAGFTCREIATGVKQCLPTGSQCVVDACSNVNCNPISTEPWCNPSTGTCVQCLNDNHCGSDQFCQANICVTPGACTDDPSCSGNSAGSRCCQTTTGRQCRQCCDNSHCPAATPHCVANTCQAQQDPCAGVICNPPQTCNPATGNCEGTGTGPSSCSSDADCGGTMACDPLFNFCYDPAGVCATNDNCAPGQTCALLVCTGCLSAGNLYCPPGQFCFFDVCIALQ